MIYDGTADEDLTDEQIKVMTKEAFIDLVSNSFLPGIFRGDKRQVLLRGECLKGMIYQLYRDSRGILRRYMVNPPS